MTDIIEVRRMPDYRWGVYHIGRNELLRAYDNELWAYRFAFGYLTEMLRDTALQSSR